MRTFRVTRLGQGQDFIRIEDFRGYVNQANSSLKRVADIARAYDLTPDDRNAISTEVNKVAGFTIAMAQRPAGEPATPMVAMPNDNSWLPVALGSLVVGGLIGYFAL